METLLQIAKEFGVYAAVVAFFIWRDWKRETDMGARLNQREEYIEKRMADVVERNTAALAAIQEVIIKCKREE